MTLTLALVTAALAFFALWRLAERDTRRALHALANAEGARLTAIQDLHSVANRVMGGYPLVKWTHPNPAPASDKWYYKARFDGQCHLFTEEAVLTARERASLLLNPKA